MELATEDVTLRRATSAEDERIADVGTLIRRADDDVASYEESLTSAMGKADKHFHAALRSIYAACHAMTEDDRAAFLLRKKIKVAKQCRNPYQPMVRAFVKEVDPTCRSKLTKAANTIAYAASEKVAPEDFRDFVKQSGGVKGVNRLWSKRNRERPEEKIDRLQDREFRIKTYLGSSPSDPYAPDIRVQGVGKVLIAAVVQPDGTFRLHRVLDMDEPQIDQLLYRLALEHE